MMTADGPAEIGTTVYRYLSAGNCIERLTLEYNSGAAFSPTYARFVLEHCALTPERAAEIAIAHYVLTRPRRKACIRAALARWKRENPE